MPVPASIKDYLKFDARYKRARQIGDISTMMELEDVKAAQARYLSNRFAELSGTAPDRQNLARRIILFKNYRKHWMQMKSQWAARRAIRKNWKRKWGSAETVINFMGI